MSTTFSIAGIGVVFSGVRSNKNMVCYNGGESKRITLPSINDFKSVTGAGGGGTFSDMRGLDWIIWQNFSKDLTKDLTVEGQMPNNIYEDLKKQKFLVARDPVESNKRYLQLKMESGKDNINYYFYLEFDDPITFDADTEQIVKQAKQILGEHVQTLNGDTISGESSVNIDSESNPGVQLLGTNDELQNFCKEKIFDKHDKTTNNVAGIVEKAETISKGTKNEVSNAAQNAKAANVSSIGGRLKEFAKKAINYLTPMGLLMIIFGIEDPDITIKKRIIYISLCLLTIPFISKLSIPFVVKIASVLVSYALIFIASNTKLGMPISKTLENEDNSAYGGGRGKLKRGTTSNRKSRKTRKKRTKRTKRKKRKKRTKRTKRTKRKKRK